MATSGSVDFTMTATQVVTKAFRKLGIIPAETPLTDDEVQDGILNLNLMLKNWQNQPLHLWTKEEGILFLDVGVENYKLGPTGEEATTIDDFINTTLNANQIASDTILTLVSTAGMVGASNLFTINELSTTANWITGNSGTLASANNQLTLTNGAASAGFAELSIATTPGTTYIIKLNYTKGSSISATFDIRDGATILDAVTFFATGSGRLQFTATQNSHTFRFANNSAVAAEDSILTFLEYYDKASGDKIGVRMDDGSRFWTNIPFVDSSTQVEINTPLPSAATTGNSVFTYSNIIERPLRILQLRRQTIGQNDEIESNQWSRQEYFAQPDKSSQGTPVNWYYSPQLGDGILYIWQTAQNVDQVVKFTFERPIQDIDETTNNLDIPVEWLDTVIYNLAARLSDEYEAPQEIEKRVIQKAGALLRDSLGYDEEPATLNIQVDMTNA